MRVQRYKMRSRIGFGIFEIMLLYISDYHYPYKTVGIWFYVSTFRYIS